MEEHNRITKMQIFKLRCQQIPDHISLAFVQYYRRNKLVVICIISVHPASYQVGVAFVYKLVFKIL